MYISQFGSVAQLCLTPCNPMDCSSPDFSIHGIFQARVTELYCPIIQRLPNHGHLNAYTYTIFFSYTGPTTTHTRARDPGSSAGKESACSAGDPSLILGLGGSPGEGIGYPLQYFLGFPSISAGKESCCNVGDLSSLPGLGRFPGKGHGNPLQCSCLENPRDSGAWWAAVSGVSQRHD